MNNQGERARNLALVLIALRVILGSSEGICDVQPGFALRWGTWGTGAGSFLQPTGVACDAQGNVYVADSENNRIQEFTGTGQFLRQWNGSGTPLGRFNSPEGLAVARDGSVYVAEFMGDRVSKFTSSGAYILSWGASGTGPGEFNSAGSLGIDSEGAVYVVDGANQRVQKFSADGQFIRMWGTQGSGPGQFHNPGGVAIDAEDRIFVSDGVNARIQVFSKDGEYLFEWPFSESWTIGFPGGVCIGSLDQRIYVTDLQRNEIFKFTLDGNLLVDWGEYGYGNGYLNYPGGITVDSNGRVIVTNKLNADIQVFDPSLPPPPPRPDYPAKILLHAVAAGGGVCSPPISSCLDAVVTQDLPASLPAFYHVYLLVARGAISSIGGLQCGISYDGGGPDMPMAGIDIRSWNLCADLDFHAGSEMGGPDWPGSGSGNTITWNAAKNCQVDDIAVAGYFYVAVYGGDVLKITPRPVDNLAAVGDCLASVVNLTPSDLGNVSFSADENGVGCNPCVSDCESGSPMERTTWSGIKALFYH